MTMLRAAASVMMDWMVSAKVGAVLLGLGALLMQLISMDSTEPKEASFWQWLAVVQVCLVVLQMVVIRREAVIELACVHGVSCKSQ